MMKRLRTLALTKTVCAKLPLLFTALVLTATLFAQNSVNWKTTIGNKKVFIENKSQFDGKNNLPGSAILFATENGPVQIFFTKQGLTYSLIKKTRKYNKENEAKEAGEKEHKSLAEREKEEHEVTITKDVVQMEWENANAGVKVTGTEVSTGYQNFFVEGKTVSAQCFKKLVYQNLYPGIDVEYTFHPATGIEYSFIIHPGADVSQIKMKYSDVSRVSSDAQGNLHFPTKFGDIIDHAPVTYYQNDRNSAVASKFIKSGKTISFQLADYDNTKTIVIDPWTVTPALPNSNKVFRIQSDSSGNAYIYGGDSPYLLEKYNSTGTWQWTYTTPWDSSDNWMGTLATDPSGNCYITSGSTAAIQKVTTGGTEVWSNTGASTDEYWNLAFNCDYSQLIAGGTRLVGLLPITGSGRIFNINLNSGAVLSNTLVAHALSDVLTKDPNEVRALSSSPNGNYYYLTLDTVGAITSGFTVLYDTLSTYRYAYGSPDYGFTPQGQATIRASATNLYSTDGANLHKRNINTGGIVSTVAVPGGAVATSAFVDGNAAKNGGIAIDSCGNVYVGSQMEVIKFDANLNQLSTAVTPNAVYDVQVTTNGNILACGDHFAVSLAMSACPAIKAICQTVFTATASEQSPLCAGSCNGTATASYYNGTGSITYSWSNGQTTQTATGLCPGPYSVTVTDAATSATSSASVSVAQPGAFTATASNTASSCSGNTGTATANVTSGTGPYTYSWSNNGTAQTINTLPAGTYTVTVSGSGGCSTTASTTISATGGLSVTPSATAATCGLSNGTAGITVTGTGSYTYSWSNGGTTQNINNLPAATYTVTVSGTGGCSATASADVTTTGSLSVTPAVTATSCGLTNGTAGVTATGSGPFTYSWSNNSTAQTLSNLPAGTYAVTVSGTGNCSATANAVVDSSVALSVTAFGGRAGCTSSGTALVNINTGTGPFTYSWNNGATSSSINSLSAGNYSVTVTGAANCSASTTVTVISTGTGVTLTASSTPSGCSTSTGSINVDATTGDSPFTYSWSNGATSATVNNIGSGTYTVTVTASGGCSATASTTVSAAGTINITANATGTSCGNSNGSASVNAGVGIFTYSWSNSATTDTIQNLAAGTYTVTVQELSGCTGTASAVVNSSGGAISIEAQPSAICQGDTSQICAPTGFQQYLWNMGETTACISVTRTGTYSVSAVDNANCTATSNQVTVTVNVADTVSITQHGDSLIAGAASGYQWYFNGAPINGATLNFYVPTEDGDYYVKTTDQNGCSAYTRTEVIKTILGINELSAASEVKVYPNPLANGNWHLDVSAGWIGSYCEVYDAAGRLVFKTEIKSAQSELDLNVAQGVYMMQINSGQKNYAIKLVKL